MNVRVYPRAGYVVVQAEEAQSKTASGLYLPGGTAEKPKVAKVVAVGAGVVDVAAGDRILYKNEYEATNVKVDSESYIVVFEQNIIATVK